MEFNRLLHWNILHEVERDFADKVKEFLVIGNGGEGVLMVTEPEGEAYWFGEMKFGWEELKKSKKATKPDGEGHWFGEMDFEWEKLKKPEKVTKPTRLGVSNLVRMAQGRNHIVLLDGMGQIYTLGMNNRGQLGQGTVDKTINFIPQPITSHLRFTEVRCGAWHSLALTEDGKVWAWGYNYYGQVGLPSSTPIPSPRQISELDSHRVVALKCGALHSLALTDKGQVYGWGFNGYGQLSKTDLSPQPTPVLLPNASLVTQIAAGFGHTLLLTEDGGVFACGCNDFGQLGLPISSTNQANPTLCKVSGLPPISQIASHFGTNLSIPLSTDRRCFVWGECNQAKSPTPLQLPPFYSTIESPLSVWSTRQNTPHSVRIEVSESSLTSDTDALYAPDSLQDRVSRMFDNPDSAPDLQFVLREKSILAHRAVIQLSTANFTGLFPESPRCRPVDLSPNSPKTSLPQPTSTSTRHTTNPSEPDTTPPTPSPLSPDITRVPILGHSYPVFHSFVRYIYTGLFQVPVDLLPDLFELSLSFQCPDLQQLCLTRMLSTVSLSTCCPYYQLAERHQLSKIQTQVVKFTADNLVLVLRTEAFRSMDSELARKMTLASSDVEDQAES